VGASKVPDFVLGPGNTVVKKRDRILCPSNYMLVRKIDNEKNIIFYYMINAVQKR
jgi:hypothetical protein